jgi:O-antigen ligase
MDNLNYKIHNDLSQINNNKIVNLTFLILVILLLFTIFVFQDQMGYFIYVYLGLIAILLVPLLLKYIYLLPVLLIIVVFTEITTVLGKITKLLIMVSVLLLILKILQKRKITILWSNTSFFVFLYLLVVSFSVIFTQDYDTLYHNLYDLLRSVVFFILILYYVNYADSESRRNNMTKLFINGIIVGSSIAATVIIVFFLQKPSIHALLGSSYEFRTGGWIRDPNDVALMLDMAIILTYFIFKSLKNKYMKILYLTSIFLCISAVILTLSRGGLIALFLIFVIILYQERKNKILMTIITIIIISIMFLFGSYIFSRLSTLSQLGSLQDKSLYLRLNLVKIAFKAIFHSPLFGVGLGDFPSYTRYFFSDSQLTNTVTHNAWLHIASETGLIGLFMYIMVFVTLIKSLNKNEKFVKMKGLLENFFYLKGLKYALIIFIIPATFLSVHHKTFIWVYWSLSLCMCNIQNKEV